MQAYDIILKKRNGGKISSEEIEFIISGYTAGKVPDYQMSAFLMAAFIKGMDEGETFALARSMTESGGKADLSGVKGVKADKHSTGGVGDGTSLVVAPLAASLGLVVPMMAGRGLGHTGGTIDKLESIPGFKTDIAMAGYVNQLRKMGVAITAQSEDIAPADRKIYALRDVTATVESISFIASSIMSKKLAEGCDTLLLDVKCGSGAFMKDIEGARKLAGLMAGIGNTAGLATRAVITNMNQPLGNAIGNSVEIKQAIETMKGRGPDDFAILCIELAARMLVMSGAEKDIVTAKKKTRDNITNGACLEKFKCLIEAQGGDASVIDGADRVMGKAPVLENVVSTQGGYMCFDDVSAVGRAAVLLGAGRRSKEEAIDSTAGVIVYKKHGDHVDKGERMFDIFSHSQARIDEARASLLKGFEISEEKNKPESLVLEEL